jgi:hypothetical protein
MQSLIWHATQETSEKLPGKSFTVALYSEKVAQIKSCPSNHIEFLRILTEMSVHCVCSQPSPSNYLARQLDHIWLENGTR